jgi:hypothetical protein
MHQDIDKLANQAAGNWYSLMKLRKDKGSMLYLTHKQPSWYTHERSLTMSQEYSDPNRATDPLPKPIDITIENHRSVFLFHLHSDAARTWVEDNVSTESWQWFGQALAVDHHCARDLAQGMLDDGFTVE